MCPPRDLPIDEAEAKGSNLVLITTTVGGHLGTVCILYFVM